MNKITPFLMFNDQLEAAIEFYSATFSDFELTKQARTGPDGICSAEFVLCGQPFMAFNGGEYFSFSQGFSLYLDCDDQDEVDRYWQAFVDGGATPLQCGWLTDRFGISWQIVPKRFIEMIGDDNTNKVKAVMDTMMSMEKLDIATLEQAFNDA
jgi:predicted 3-demethylubiquinone-9 3-methyltransferase (glyoxalase superfamily)